VIILIPAFEPDAKLTALVRSLRAADPDLAVVIVDDGSGPAYRPVFTDAQRVGCQVIRYSRNRGKGHALKTGFSFIRSHLPGQAVICADSDGQHTFVDILRVAARMQDCPAAMVLGTRRFDGTVPARSRFGNAVSRWMFLLATGQRIGDTQTGLRGYPAPMLPWLLSVSGDRYEYELNLLLQAHSACQAIETVDISTIYLAGNKSSHFRPLVDSARIYAPLLRFCLSSLTAFAVDAAALFTLSALTGSLLAAVIGARAISSAINFLTNRRLVFEHGRDRPAAAAAVGYFALVLALLGANYALLAGLTAAGLALAPAKLLTEAVLFTASYTVQKRFLFACRLKPSYRRLGADTASAQFSSESWKASNQPHSERTR
jgi:glycosyltransferase involved in cell wall biosynthesis